MAAERQPLGEWLREEFRADFERWRRTSTRGWVLTGVETVFTVGLGLRLLLHVLLLGMLDQVTEIEWGLAVTPARGADPSTVTDVRWVVAGVGLLMVSYGLSLPTVAKIVWVLQALPLLADFAISVGEDLDIGGDARLRAAASHLQAQDYDQTHSD